MFIIKYLQVDPILIQMDPFHMLFNIHFNSTLPSMPVSSTWYLSFWISDQHFYDFLIYPMHVHFLSISFSVIWTT